MTILFVFKITTIIVFVIFLILIVIITIIIKPSFIWQFNINIVIYSI